MPVPGEFRGWPWLDGRAGRTEFIVSTLILSAWIALMARAPANAVHLFAPWLMTFQMVRRVHDLGRSWWWVLGWMVADAAIYGGFGATWGSTAASVFWLLGLVALAVAPGEKTANRYGPPPGRRRATASAD